MGHPTDMNPANLSTTPIDPTGKYVLTTRCRTGRSVRGTRLPPCTTFEERRELERVIVKGLEGLTGDLKGEYFPLHGSQSFAAKPTTRPRTSSSGSMRRIKCELSPCKRAPPSSKSSSDSPPPPRVSRRFLKPKVTTSCTTTILAGS